MYKIRLHIVVKTNKQERNQVFESYLYKEVNLPFIPEVGLKISMGDSNVLPPIVNIIWDANENYFICQCADEMKIEPIGKDQKHLWHAGYVDCDFKQKGWILLEEDDQGKV
jgi:hypothetical protein